MKKIFFAMSILIASCTGTSKNDYIVVKTTTETIEVIDSIKIVSQGINQEQKQMIQEIVAKHVLEDQDLDYTTKKAYSIANINDDVERVSIKRSFMAGEREIGTKTSIKEKAPIAEMLWILITMLSVLVIVLFRAWRAIEHEFMHCYNILQEMELQEMEL